MKQAKTHRFQPRLEVLESRLTPSTTRPLSDFLATQGSADNFNFGVPGLPQEIGWGTSTATFEAGTNKFARIDYTGQDAAFLNTLPGVHLPTPTTSGTVMERKLPDGTAQVTVHLDTNNAFAWAIKQDPILPFESWPVIFGSTPQQLAAGATPSLADSHFDVVLTTPAPGAVLPDLVGINLGGLPTGYSLVSMSFRATAHGTTPTGQQATLVVSQTGVLQRSPNVAHDFGFTAEVVDVHANNGKDSGPPAPASATTALTTPAPSPTAKNAHSSVVDAVFADLLNDPLSLSI